MLSTDNVIRFTPRQGHTPISATPRASAMIERIARKHGPVAIYQSGGCCDGSLPLCLGADELGQGPRDVIERNSGSALPCHRRKIRSRILTEKAAT
jgi:uncharacterized protein (DUF779 family)